MRAALSLMFLLAAAAHAEGERLELWVDGGRAEVEFQATGRPALTVTGRMKDNPAESLKGTFFVEGYKATGEAVLKLDSLDTGIALRTRHMKEKYLETAKHPTAKFVLTDLNVPRDFKDGFQAEESFKGRLTLREKEKPVEGRVRMTGDAQSMDWRFELTFKTTDFKIDPPTFLGVTMAEDVTLKVRLPLQGKKASTAP